MSRIHLRLVGAALVLAGSSGCASFVERPSWGEFRAGRLVGMELDRPAQLPHKELWESLSQHGRATGGLEWKSPGSAIPAYEFQGEYVRIAFGRGAEAEAAEVFFVGKWDPPRTPPRSVDAAIWTPRFEGRRGWQAEVAALGLRLGSTLGFAPDFGAVISTTAPELFALVEVDAASPGGRLAGVLRCSKHKEFFGKHGGLVPLDVVTARVERALATNDLDAARADRTLLAGVVTGEANDLLSRLDDALSGARRARRSSGLASLGNVPVPPLAEELVSLAKEAGSDEALVVRANEVVRLASAWAKSALKAKFSLFSEVSRLARAKVGGTADAATARVVVALHGELLKDVQQAAVRAEQAGLVATTAGLRLLEAGLVAPPGASTPTPESLQAARRLLEPLIAKVVPVLDPAGPATPLARPGFDEELASTWPVFARAGVEVPRFDVLVTRARAVGNAPLVVSVEAGSLDVSAVLPATEFALGTSVVMRTERQRNPAFSQWENDVWRLNQWRSRVTARNNEIEKARSNPKQPAQRAYDPNSVADRWSAASSVQAYRDAQQAMADEDAALASEERRVFGVKPPREIDVQVPTEWKFDVQRQRWTGTATRRVRVGAGGRDEVLVQAFDVGAVAGFRFDRNASDPLHNVAARDDWKERGYVEARLPALMDAAVPGWIRPVLARRRVAAIEALSPDVSERRWLLYFLGALPETDRRFLDPAEPGADPSFVGVPVASGNGESPRRNATPAVAEVDKLVPLASPPMSLSFHPDGARLVVARVGAIDLHHANGELEKNVTTTLRSQAVAVHSPDGRRFAVLDGKESVRIYDEDGGSPVYAPLPASTLGFGGFSFSDDSTRVRLRKWGTGVFIDPTGGVTELGPGQSDTTGRDRWCAFEGTGRGRICRVSGRVVGATSCTPPRSDPPDYTAGTQARVARTSTHLASANGAAQLCSGGVKGRYGYIQRVDREEPLPLQAYRFDDRYGGFAFTQDGRQLVGARSDGRVLVWDGLTGRLLREYPAPRPGLVATDVVVSPDGTTLVVGYAVGERRDTGWLRVLRRAYAE